MTFLTILEVTKILCSFRLVLEGKTGKEIPESSILEILDKFSANNFALSGAEDYISGLLQKVPRAKFLGSDALLCFISIFKFGSFKNPFAMIPSLSELCFRLRRFILLVQMKKVISMNYGSCASSWKPWRWVRLDLIPLMRYIDINSNATSLIKSAAAETLSLKIPSHGTSLKWSERPSQSTREMQWNGASRCEYNEKSMETETATSEFPNNLGS